MVELTCSTNWCKSRAEYYSHSEDSYYCTNCTHAMFNPKDLTKIGDVAVIRQMIKLSKNLLKKVRDYAIKEQLTQKWKEALEKLPIFDVELRSIKDDYESALIAERLKDFDTIQQRFINLKLDITESEVYKKYLFHKEMNELMKREKIFGENLFTAKTVKNIEEIKSEEHNSTLEERLLNFSNLIESESTADQNIEEFKKICLDEIESIKQQQRNERKQFEKDREYWFALRSELEKDFKNFVEDRRENLPSISYDELSTLHMKHLGQLTVLDKDSAITFDLKEENWLNYLITLSKFRIPRIYYLYLNNVPSDCEQVRTFMKDSVPIHNRFYFNNTKQVQIEGSKYIDALKSVAAKVTDYLYINNTDLTGQEFCDLVSAAKFCLYLYFDYDLIAFDEKLDFSKEMEGCRIKNLSLDYSGFHRYSDWGHNMHRFENMVEAIARCSPLLNSLKTIYISNCDITKVKAAEILAKYSCSKIAISGV